MTAVGSPFGQVPLSLAFLDRAAVVHGNRVGLVDGGFRHTYAELADRTRLSADELSFIVEHAQARVLLVDTDLAMLGVDVAERVGHDVRVVLSGGDGDEYEQLLAAARPQRVPVADELSLLSLNYTSGTTGRPKGVMYSHRGAYLQALAMLAQTSLTARSVLLCTLPMFHCNGWCFPWALTAAGGTHDALRKVDPGMVWWALREEGVTHLCAAPTVLTSLAAAPEAEGCPLPATVRVATGGAPPSPALLSRMEALGFDVTHLYGLTRTYGLVAICDWRAEGDDLPGERKARLKARQGVANLVSEPLRVLGEDGRDVPADGETVGEVLLRGNNVMLGYYLNPDATAAADVDGWFRTGELAVLHADGYVEPRDRAKDIIISGGENIASIEVEQALESHPAVIECAVVGAPDEHWGERSSRRSSCCGPAPTRRRRSSSSTCAAGSPGSKAPRRMYLGDLPKTGTCKIQKYVLRQQVHEG